MTDTVYVYTIGRPGAMGSWSRYTFPWDITEFAHLGNDMFIRHGDQVSKVVDSGVTDEIVSDDPPGSFAAIADLPATSDKQNSIALRGSLAAIAEESSPYIHFYDVDADVFTEVAAPSTLPTGRAVGVAISPDETYVAVAHDTSPFITVYKRDRYGVFNKLANPSSLPAGNATSVSWSDDGAYLAVAHAGSPYVSVYKLASDVLTKLSALPDTHATGPSTKVAYAGADLAVGYSATPYLKIYKQAGDSFSTVDILGTAMDATVTDMSFSSEFLACVSSGKSNVYIFEREGNFYRRTTLTEPSAGTLPQAVAFAPGGKLLVVGTFTLTASKYFVFHEWDGTEFSSIDVSALTNADGSVYAVGISGDHIVMGNGGTDPNAYSWNGGGTITNQNFSGVLHWPWLDFGQIGVHKRLIAFDNVGTGTSAIQFGYDQSNLSTFTTSYSIPADSAPGTIIPTFVSAPSISVKITYDGGQSWLWNATTIYLRDTQVGT